MSVAIVERHLVGSTCVNTGCGPTKAMVVSAYAEQLLSNAGALELTAGEVDWPSIQEPPNPYWAGRSALAWA
jgi:pyruvate/2-oxoglutarate dehydrogenase complex dihydrolipoamide dehydrogenase (E3) component